MKKSEVKNQILEKIAIMEQNTFLFPPSWSDTIDMIDEDWSYKTYNSGSKGISRYHNIEIHYFNKKILDINFRGNSIQVIQDLDNKTVSFNDVLKYVTSIFDEKHSFKNHNEGKRKIRESINKNTQQIEQLKKDIALLKTQLIDLDKI
jgi:hypothetical protein